MREINAAYQNQDLEVLEHLQHHPDIRAPEHETAGQRWERLVREIALIKRSSPTYNSSSQKPRLGPWPRPITATVFLEKTVDLNPLERAFSIKFISFKTDGAVFALESLNFGWNSHEFTSAVPSAAHRCVSICDSHC